MRKTLVIPVFVVLLALLSPLSAGPAYAACATPVGAEGDIVYNAAERVFQFCDNVNWRAMNKPGTGSGGCANPTMNEGGIAYNADYRVLQGCAGSTHQAMGEIGGLNDWTQIAVSAGHTCGLKENGRLWCWGSDQNGALGNGAVTGSQLTPYPVTGVWKYIVAGDGFTCGIKSDDTAWCWGYDASGQLGDGAGFTNQTSPVAVTGGATWKALSAGLLTACGIKTDDTLWCWGDDTRGQLGNGAVTTTNQPAPVIVSGGSTWKAVDVGGFSVCGIQSDDTLWCWGRNDNGQLGNGTSGADQTVPDPIGADAWKRVSVGSIHTCGIKMDNTAWCWGHDSGGELGNGGVAGNQLSPSAVAGGYSWKEIASSGGNYYNTCAIQTDDSLWCWGDDQRGEIANGATTGTQTSPVAVSGGGVWTAIGAGDNGDHSCGIKGGALYCWGVAGGGILGNNTTDDRSVPTAINDPGPWQDLSARNQSCAIKPDGSLWCWGWNASGQLGDGTSITRQAPTAISGGGTWKQAGVGYTHSCGIKSDDTLWCWGSNSNGQLGDNSTTQRLVPTAINGGGTWKQVDSSSAFTCGIKSDDSLWCWGLNANGQLGDNSTTQRLVPTAINGGGTWKRVDVGSDYACGIKSDDTLWCWGLNGNGQLGDNSTTQRLVPTAINGGGTWKQVSAGGTNTCGIKTDDTLWCWGDNANGRLGDGTTTQRLVPTAINGGGTWKQVSASAGSCAIKSDDTLWCWGSNAAGRLGDGTTTQRLVPTAVSGGGTWEKVQIHAHACALSTQGLIYCWGLNNAGELTATEYAATYRDVPTQTWCGSPAGKPGAIRYNTDLDVVQYCDGAGWVAANGIPSPPDPCAGSPAAGTVCNNGSYYIGQIGGNDIYATAAASESTQTWNNGTANYSDTLADSLTDGAANTAALVALADAGAPYDAAVYCDGLTNVHGHSDWYLPAEDELNLFWNGGSPVAGVNTSGSYYVSSTESNNTDVRLQKFDNGQKVGFAKSGSRLVRCVRR
ncbi:MAG: RCC1 domain-containing protein [Micavibrio sp.]